jgi:hypothetical protein
MSKVAAGGDKCEESGGNKFHDVILTDSQSAVITRDEKKPARAGFLDQAGRLDIKQQMPWKQLSWLSWQLLQP